MKIIIPVAGVGKRLRPHTHSLPKPLLAVAGKPVLAHILDQVVGLNPDEVVFIVGYRGDEIRRWVAENYSFPSRFVRQDKLLGLGYALNLGLDEVDAGPVLVILGDTIVDCDLDAMTAAGEYVLGLRAVDDPTRFGIAEVADGVVVKLEEKPADPKSNLALIGLYYFAELSGLKSALEELVRSGATTRGEIQLTDALEIMIRRGTEFRTYEVAGWYDCGKKETMLETNAQLLAKLPPPQPIDGCVLIPPVFIADDANVTGSVIGPNVSISSGSTIEHSVIRNAIIGNRSTIANMVLADSLIGNDVSLRGTQHVLNIGDHSVLQTS